MTTDDGSEPSFFARYIDKPEKPQFERPHIEIEKTEPRLSLKQRRLRANSVFRWAQWCIDNNTIRTPYGASIDLGRRVLKKDLDASYALACKEQHMHPTNGYAFGRKCSKMFGLKQRVTKASHDCKRGQYRPYAYDVPTAGEWQKRLNALLGIPAGNETDQPDQNTIGTTLKIKLTTI